MYVCVWILVVVTCHNECRDIRRKLSGSFLYFYQVDVRSFTVSSASSKLSGTQTSVPAFCLCVLSPYRGTPDCISVSGFFHGIQRSNSSHQACIANVFICWATGVLLSLFLNIGLLKIFGYLKNSLFDNFIHVYSVFHHIITHFLFNYSLNHPANLLPILFLLFIGYWVQSVLSLWSWA